jgi:hypothetical protein
MNRIGKRLILGAWAVLGAVCAYAMIEGQVFAEAGRILRMPWGLALFVDIYVGFLLFSGWVLHREWSVAVAAVWIAFILVAGNLVACLYVLLAFRQSRGDWNRFWRGEAISPPEIHPGD